MTDLKRELNESFIKPLKFKFLIEKLRQNSEKNAINPQQAQPKQQVETVQPVVQTQTNQTETVSEIQEKSINNPQRDRFQNQRLYLLNQMS